MRGDWPVCSAALILSATCSLARNWDLVANKTYYLVYDVPDNFKNKPDFEKPAKIHDMKLK
jgi:hypothetical protein